MASTFLDKFSINERSQISPSKNVKFGFEIKGSTFENRPAYVSLSTTIMLDISGKSGERAKRIKFEPIKPAPPVISTFISPQRNPSSMIGSQSIITGCAG
jgi:hypothetical protein